MHPYAHNGHIIPIIVLYEVTKDMARATLIHQKYICNYLSVEGLYYSDINIVTLCVAAFSQSIGKEDMKIVGMLLLIFVSSVAAGGRVPAQYGLKPCKDPVVCVADPCEVTTCPEFPEADCISDFCDCSARFFVGFREVTDKCQSHKTCANIGAVTQVDCDTMDQCSF